MRGDARRLRDILSSIEDIQAFTAGMAEEDFLRLEASDRMKFRAVCNCVTTLGEAVKNLSPEITAKNSAINFSGYAGMKDIIRHQYFRVQFDLLWKTISAVSIVSNISACPRP
ncbi:MAG: HepT-like ribonuclease domain-containing protein [Rhodospirillales bacterium]